MVAVVIVLRAGQIRSGWFRIITWRSFLAPHP
jgi:hypothetical protein